MAQAKEKLAQAVIALKSAIELLEVAPAAALAPLESAKAVLLAAEWRTEDPAVAEARRIAFSAGAELEDELARSIVLGRPPSLEPVKEKLERALELTKEAYKKVSGVG